MLCEKFESNSRTMKRNKIENSCSQDTNGNETKRSKSIVADVITIDDSDDENDKLADDIDSSDSSIIEIAEIKPKFKRTLSWDEKLKTNVLCIAPDISHGKEETPIPVKIDEIVIDWMIEQKPALERLEYDDSMSFWEKVKKLDLETDGICTTNWGLHCYLPRAWRRTEKCWENDKLVTDYPKADFEALCTCDCTDGCKSDQCACKRITWSDNKEQFYNRQTKKVQKHKEPFTVSTDASHEKVRVFKAKHFPYKKTKLLDAISVNAESGELSTGIIHECSIRCHCQKLNTGIRVRHSYFKTWMTNCHIIYFIEEIHWSGHLQSITSYIESGTYSNNQKGSL